MKPSVLLAEDDAAIRMLLNHHLVGEGYRVVEAQDGDIAWAHLSDNLPDLAVLDWMMPGISGLEICRRVRSTAKMKSLPIILLTARGEESDRIRGLNTGADDYIVKPFSISEVKARIHAVMRRIRPALAHNELVIGDISISRETRRVVRNGEEIHLGPREFALLMRLMDAPGRVFSRAQLLDGVWGQDTDVEERTVDVHVGRLRRALNSKSSKDPIRTVRAAGYAFDENFS
ncbi:MAG: phosphate regulon transcriptional regulatory protein PhoB [SAR116 cluster bacterium]|nr:phosphate regulon transcriptional regulatory protein PhoB [Paracoccaceae bacterium]RCL77703.1 MAG: phosphate regulon transcriptional regulatory protein PhoB [SAR116 cluster bacterium]HBQ23122.1 phosphate regulon transcriptional regulatory protein PhoB [Alphaproteobacteria bacterium]|tara:strand:- start:342 stop:1034 length:693 start_codon:yes stop_codon:yes gene_type:complete